MKRVHSYTVIKETNTHITQIDSWDELLANAEQGYSKLILVIDKKLTQFIPSSIFSDIIEIDGGDAIKSINVFNDLIHRIAISGLDRKGHLIAIGGGSISDLVGYAASVYLRGVSFSIVPSTLLSLIDASIGGKNGINFRASKNQIGTIYQPSGIYFFPEIIQKLPSEEMSDGFAEIIKYGLIMDGSLFQRLTAFNLESILSNKALFEDIIHSCIIHKSTIVEDDPFEGNQRRILNFGHTIGHAIESSYGLSHGKSVGLGMLFAVKMSEYYYGFDSSLYQKLKEVLSRFNLPTSMEKFSAKVIFDKIKSDKKRENENIFFVLIPEIGKAKIEMITLAELNSYIIKAEQEGWMSS